MQSCSLKQYLKTQKELEKTYWKLSFYLYFLMQQKLLKPSEKMWMSAEHMGCVLIIFK